MTSTQRADGERVTGTHSGVHRHRVDLGNLQAGSEQRHQGDVTGGRRAGNTYEIKGKKTGNTQEKQETACGVSLVVGSFCPHGFDILRRTDHRSVCASQTPVACFVSDMLP